MRQKRIDNLTYLNIYNNIFEMIKKNSANTRQQLLRKNSEQSIPQYPPFEVQDCYSVVDFDDKDHSYYCLGTEQGTNPYFIQLTERQPEVKPNYKNEQKCMPDTIAMNGNYYQKIDCGEKNPIADEMYNSFLYSKAICGSCTTIQLIPKGSTKFYCYACRTLCKCGDVKTKQPEQSEQTKTRPASPIENAKTKLFICGNCAVKVKYEVGSSKYIRCSKCNTVNMVAK